MKLVADSNGNIAVIVLCTYTAIKMAEYNIMCVRSSIADGAAIVEVDRADQAHDHE